MTITYTKSILGLRCHADAVDGFSDVVYEVQWCVSAADGEYAARIGMRTLIPYVSGGSLIPYESLTPVEVMAWVNSQVPESDLFAAQELVAQSIANQRLGVFSPMTVSLTSPTPPETAENGVIWKIISTNLE
jgi:hypothetical protein